MHIGTIIVQNDVIGILVAETKHTMTLKLETGRLVTINKGKYAEVANPFALACLYYKKIVSKIRSNWYGKVYEWGHNR